MSASGYQQPKANVCGMSALLPRADIGPGNWHVSFGPLANIDKYLRDLSFFLTIKGGLFPSFEPLEERDAKNIRWLPLRGCTL
jgi:hypothetical protein